MDVAAFASEARHLGMARAILRSGYHRLNRHVAARLYRFVILTPETVDPELRARPLALECRMLPSEEIGRLAHDPAYAGTSVVPHALRRGDLCQVVRDGASLANIGWYASEPTEVDDLVSVDFDRRYLYMHHGYTWPAYRGQDLHGIGLARALDEAVARGYAGLVGIAERVNFASLRSAHRTGFRDCGTALILGSHARLRVLSSLSARRAGFRVEPLRRDDRSLGGPAS